jgi:cytoskeletal protein CcmA (bactofilin family)
MWKSNKREADRTFAPAPAYIPPPQVAPATTPLASVAQPKSEVPQKMADIAHIGKSVVIRGELSGSEDLFLDGEVEGSIELKGHSLTVGPNGHIRANINAQEVVINGRVTGNIRGTDRVELKKSAVLTGDIFTQRIVIEEGAFFKGAVDIQKPDARPEIKPEPKKEAAAAATGATAAPPSITPAAHSPLV